MSICLCNQSAEKILDLIALKRFEQSGRAGLDEFESCTAGKQEVNAALSMLPEMERPVHLLVSSQKQRVCDDGRRSHVWSGNIEDGSLIRVAPSVFVASPEFNMLLQMRGLSLIERVLTLMGCCGIFAIDESSDDGFVRRPQLTTIDRLRAFAKRMKPECSSRILLEAADYVIEHARSPLEARLAYVLTTPWEMGGFGLPRPQLNALIDVGEHGAALVGVSSLECDLVWNKQRVILEANGKLRHEGRFGDDLTKASALELNRYSVRFVTSQQLRSPRQMLLLGSWVMERLGIERLLPEKAKLGQLLKEVLAFEYHHISLS